MNNLLDQKSADPSGPILSFTTQEALQQVGQHLRDARLRRGESVATVATRAGVTRHTWSRLEEGHPGVSIGLLFEALQLYGFAQQLFELGHPDLDTEGAARDAARRPKHGRAVK